MESLINTISQRLASLDKLIIGYHDKFVLLNRQAEEDRVVHDMFIQKENEKYESSWFYHVCVDAEEITNYQGDYVDNMSTGEPWYDDTGSKGAARKMEETIKKLEKESVRFARNLERGVNSNNEAYLNRLLDELNQLL